MKMAARSLNLNRVLDLRSRRTTPGAPFWFQISTHPNHREISSASSAEADVEAAARQEAPRDAEEVFRRCGCCTAWEASQILGRHPSVARMSLANLQSKLQVLRRIGLVGPHLVKIINCRPRFLCRRIGGPTLDARLHALRSLFHSDDDLLRAIVRNPSLLSYDVDGVIRPCVRLYEGMGVGGYELGRLLISRPSVLLRSRMNDEKVELLRRTGLPSDAPMYKYALSLIAVSRLETLLSKIANLERIGGFSSDEVMALFARSPNVLTLSVHKVQRNMTYVVSTMNLSPHVALREPALLYSNLEKVLRPRYLLGLKLREMGLQPQILGPSSLVKAICMKEPRFLRAFVHAHQEGIAATLMDLYSSLKSLTRLAESSRTRGMMAGKAIPF